MSDDPNSAQPLSSLPAEADPLELLFREIVAAGNQLKITTALLNRADRLPPGGLSVLQLLGRAGRQTVPQIARYRMTSRQNIQVTINRLAAQGWVESISNPAHRRSGLYQLTAKGRTLLSEAEHRTIGLRVRLMEELETPTILRVTDFVAGIREKLAAFGKGAALTSPKHTAQDQPTGGKRPVAGARKVPADQGEATPSTNEAPLSIPQALADSEIPLSLL